MNLSRKQTLAVAIVLAIVTLLSPFYFSFHSDMYETTITIYSLFLMIYFDSQNTLVIRLNEYWVVLGYVPFVVFRLGVPLQFIRYYEMRVSRFALAMTGVAGEIPPLLMIPGMLPSFSLSQIVCTLPFHLLICAIVVLLRPVNYNVDIFHE